MSVFGGNQIRPNIHIQDLVNVYKHFISNPDLPSGFYNAGFENLKIIDIAKKVAKIIPSEIVINKNNDDPRSYRQNSSKLFSTGFKKITKGQKFWEKYILDNFKLGFQTGFQPRFSTVQNTN